MAPQLKEQIFRVYSFNQTAKLIGFRVETLDQVFSSPTSLTNLVIKSWSAMNKVLNSSLLKCEGSMPCDKSLFDTASSRIAPLIALLSRSTVALGVAAGASSPNQDSKAKSLGPVSLMQGISGCRLDLFFEVIPNALMRGSWR